MKKALSFLLVFIFCLGSFSVLSVADNNDCHDCHDHSSDVFHVHAAGPIDGDPDDPDNPGEPGGNTTVDEPSFLFYNVGPLSSDGTSHSRTEAVVDPVHKTVTFKIIVKATGNCVGLPHCRDGSITLTYDSSIFSFVSGDGTLMNQQYNTLYINEKVGSVTLKTYTGYNEEYVIEADLTLELSFDGLDFSKVTDFVKSFTIEFSCSSELYKKSPYSEKKTVTAMICPHDLTKEVSVAATCKDSAHIDTVCERCGTVVSTKPINFLITNHTYDYNDIVRVPNQSNYSGCTKTGVTVEYKCRVCGELHRATDLEYHVGLNTNNKVYDEATGKYVYYCANGHKVVAKIQSPDVEECKDGEHDFEEQNRTASTCTKEGSVVYRCKKCGKIVTETLPLAEHTYTTWTVTKPATCIEEGERTSDCSVCGHHITESIPKADHSFGEWSVIKEPTCAESGLRERVCTVCKTEKQTEVIEALGHDFGEEVIIKVPTCSEDGEAVRVCKRCSEEETIILPKDPEKHKFGEWETTVAPTCVTEGIQTRTCEICEAQETKNIGLGTHNYIKTVISELSCYEDGLVRYECEYCSDHYEDTEKCEGHIFELISPDEKTVIKRCKSCGLEIKTVKNGNKTEKIITCGVFVLRVGEKYLNSEVWLRADEIKRSSDEFKQNEQYASNLYKDAKPHTVQNEYKVSVYVNGEKVAFDEDMTLTLALDSALKNRNTDLIFFESAGSSVMITRMKEAKRSGLEYKIPTNVLSKAYNDVIILSVEGDYAAPNGDANPDSSSSRGNIIVPIVIVGAAVIVAVAASVLVLKKGKKAKFDI